MIFPAVEEKRGLVKRKWGGLVKRKWGGANVTPKLWGDALPPVRNSGTRVANKIPTKPLCMYYPLECLKK